MKRVREVSAVGREIEAALGKGRSADVLTRWMAFRLAEVRLAVESASTAEARKAALAEHDSLIMALWDRRERLPEPLGVDRRTRLASRIIEQIVVERPSWSRLDPPRDIPGVLGDLRDHCTHLCSVAAVLIYEREAVALGPEDPDLPLSAEERRERDQLAEIARIALRDISVREGSWSQNQEPSASEAVVKLEGAVRSVIAEVRDLLAELEPMLLPVGGGGQDKKSSRAGKTGKART